MKVLWILMVVPLGGEAEVAFPGNFETEAACTAMAEVLISKTDYRCLRTEKVIETELAANPDSRLSAAAMIEWR